MLVDSSRMLANLVVEEVGDNQQKFDELTRVALHDQYPFSMRAARAMSLCIDKYPQLIHSLLDDIIANIEKIKTEGVKRSILRSIASGSIPLTEDQEGYLLEICSNFIKSNSEAIAVQAYSMEIFYNISNHYPELKYELKEILKSQLTESDSTGIKTKAKNMLKVLEKETNQE